MTKIHKSGVCFYRTSILHTCPFELKSVCRCGAFKNRPPISSTLDFPTVRRVCVCAWTECRCFGFAFPIRCSVRKPGARMNVAKRVMSAALWILPRVGKKSRPRTPTELLRLSVSMLVSFLCWSWLMAGASLRGPPGCSPVRAFFGLLLSVPVRPGGRIAQERRPGWQSWLGLSLLPLPSWLSLAGSCICSGWAGVLAGSLGQGFLSRPLLARPAGRAHRPGCGVVLG